MNPEKAFDCTPTKLQEFYNRHKGIVWVLRVVYELDGELVESVGTGFALKSNGLVATSAHLLSKNYRTIEARRLDEEGFQFKAEVASVERRRDIALLQFQDVNECQFGVLTNNGSLSVGQTLLHIGNPKEFVGSFMVGKVAYECVNDIEPLLDGITCEKFQSTPLRPKYRIMGHIWNEKYFKGGRGGTYEKNLHPNVPIIQMYGLACAEGSSGGPVFNIFGEIVGIVAMGTSGFEIAIHVSMLKEILRLKEQEQAN